MIPVVVAIGAALAGTVLSAVLGCVPGIHVYNILALGTMAIVATSVSLPAEVIIPFAAGLITGYALISTIPSILLAAPDESAFFTVLPGQKYLMNGRGYEGAMITAAGGFIGLAVVVGVGGPLLPAVLPVVHAVLRPHLHWVVWCVIAFMLMSEWPKREYVGQAGWTRFAVSWSSLTAGLVTFLLSGLLGFVLMYRSPVAQDAAFQNLAPAFAGLFTVPWLILNLASRVSLPSQRSGRVEMGAGSLMHGALAGCIGGGFAAFVPVVTGGVGGFLAGHAAAIRNDKAFLVSQGASKMVYLVGGFLLFFVPTLHLTRGGGAWLIQGLVAPGTYREYHLALASMAISGGISFLTFGPLTRGMLGLIRKAGYRSMSWLSLFLVVGLIVGMTGWAGGVVLLTATGIGLLPVLWGSRRMNCLGVILLPIACSMSGVGPKLAGWLGLML